MAEQPFCVTCKYYIRRSPVGKANSGDCTFDPIWSMVKLPTTHWCSQWKAGSQRAREEMYSPTPTISTEVCVEQLTSEPIKNTAGKSVKV